VVSLLEKVEVSLVIIRCDLGKVLQVAKLLGCPAETLPVNLGDDAGHEVLVELDLAHFHVPSLDGEWVACHHVLDALAGEHVVGEELHVYLQQRRGSSAGGYSTSRSSTTGLPASVWPRPPSTVGTRPKWPGGRVGPGLEEHGGGLGS